jgi:F0F1-type ATP synthase membrane subunit b/b'
VTINLAEQKLQQRVNADQQKKLIQDFVDELPNRGSQ